MIKTEELHFSFGNKKILQNINIDIPKKSFTSIIGPNGAGKSTLLKIISGFYKNFSGRVYIDGIDINGIEPRQFSKIRSYVPQYLNLEFNLNCFEMVMLGRFSYMNFWGYERDKDIESVRIAMEKTNTYYLKERMIFEISGGEFQRLMIAQALVQESPLIILDEPTSHLDLKYQSEIMDILEDLNKNKELTVLTVLHDINLASMYSDNIILINEGSVFIQGQPEIVITEENFYKVYNRRIKVYRSKKSRSPMIMLEEIETEI